MKPTKQDLLLIAALKLPQPFTAEQLTVEAWENNRVVFGLKGYAGSFPDNNKVLTALCGQDGLVGRGKLRRVRPGLYEVVPQGGQ